MRRPSLLSCFMPTCRAQEENEKAFLGDSQVRGTTRPPAAAHVPPLQTPVYNSSTSSNRPVECSPQIWNSAMMEALPLSWAVVTSGADIVLHHHIGQESAAASVFSQAIQSMSCMGDSAAQHGENPVRKGVRPSSFLEALLGPQLEAAAWKAVRMGRPWKGNICMQLPATAHPRDPAGHCSMGISPKTTAAGKEDMQRVELATSMDTKDSAFSPRPRHLSSKGSIRFEDVDTGLDEECSLGNDGENAEGVKGSYNSLSGSFPGDSKLGSTRPLKDNLGLNCAARHDPSIQVEEKEADEQVKMERSASLSHASQLRRQRLCKNRSASFISSRSRKSSLQISETEVDRLLSEGGCESPTNMRTKTFLKSLSNMELSPSPEEGPRRYGLCMPGHKDRDISRHDARPPALAQSTTAEGKTETVDKPSFEGNNPERLPHPQPGGVGDSIMQDFSFDVSVSCLDHSMGQRNPLLVVISDSTEHLKVRTILTALAEAQLKLLADLMPQHAIKFLAMESSEAVPQCVGQLARKHRDATIMCMDICGFTAMSKEVEPEIMVFLNTLFSYFDELVDTHGVHKVETAGDCYIVSGGIMEQAADGLGQAVVESHDAAESAGRVMAFAKAILDAAEKVKMPNMQPVRVRIGMHTGAVVSGIIGTKLPKFSLFGDAMLTASRMESSGVPGRIHVSEATRILLPQDEWEATGGVEVQGKGQMESYLWVPQPACSQQENSVMAVPQGSQPQNAQRQPLLELTAAALQSAQLPSMSNSVRLSPIFLATSLLFSQRLHTVSASLPFAFGTTRPSAEAHTPMPSDALEELARGQVLLQNTDV